MCKQPLHLASRGKEDGIEQRDGGQRRSHAPEEATDAVMR